MLNVTQLKTGTIFKENNQPLQVLKYTHTKTARGGANVKVKVRNLVDGGVIDKSYVATASVDDAVVERKNMQFLYQNSTFEFMDPKSFEQTSIPASVVGENKDFLSPGEHVHVLYFDGKPVSIELPNNMVLEVAYTEPGFKGNTVTNVFKDAKLSNEITVKVPTFVKIGDKVKIDTRTRRYVAKG
jgi:elongation factor P